VLMVASMGRGSRKRVNIDEVTCCRLDGYCGSTMQFVRSYMPLDSYRHVAREIAHAFALATCFGLRECIAVQSCDVCRAVYELSESLPHLGEVSSFCLTLAQLLANAVEEFLELSYARCGYGYHRDPVKALTDFLHSRELREWLVQAARSCMKFSRICGLPPIRVARRVKRSARVLNVEALEMAARIATEVISAAGLSGEIASITRTSDVERAMPHEVALGLVMVVAKAMSRDLAAWERRGVSHRLYILLDSSGSMYMGQRAVAATALALALAAVVLYARGEVYARAFSGDTLPPPMHPPAFGAEQVLDLIASVVPSYETAIMHALRVALRDLAERSPATIVVVTDGECLVDPSIGVEARRMGVKICAAVCGNPNPNLFEAARRSGGFAYIIEPSPKHVKTFVLRAVREVLWSR